VPITALAVWSGRVFVRSQSTQEFLRQNGFSSRNHTRKLKSMGSSPAMFDVFLCHSASRSERHSITEAILKRLGVQEVSSPQDWPFLGVYRTPSRNSIFLENSEEQGFTISFGRRSPSATFPINIELIIQYLASTGDLEFEALSALLVFNTSFAAIFSESSSSRPAVNTVTQSLSGEKPDLCKVWLDHPVIETEKVHSRRLVG
jgi:hypothetical protein